MKVRIIIERSSNKETASTAPDAERLMHGASCAPEPLIPFADYLGKLGRSALKKPSVLAASPRAMSQPQAGPRGLLSRAWTWLHRDMVRTKQLRVMETVALGDKRMIAVIQADGRRFLVGGGPSGVSLLTQLDQSQNALHSFGASAGLTELAG